MKNKKVNIFAIHLNYYHNSAESTDKIRLYLLIDANTIITLGRENETQKYS